MDKCPWLLSLARLLQYFQAKVVKPMGIVMVWLVSTEGKNPLVGSTAVIAKAIIDDFVKKLTPLQTHLAHWTII